jgi:flavin reductase (DIM6/NTAB) family NADH-FMN oxidoreductase RutF
MRKNFKPNPWMYPLPVLMISTYNEDGTADVMNAAWGGMYDTYQVVLCLSEGHKTTKNIKNKKAFTVSFADAAHVTEADFVGIVSANNVPDKLEKAGLHVIKSEYVDAPVIKEFPLALECKLIKVNEDGNIIGEIVNISADESVLNQDGSIDPEKLQVISFDPIGNTYRKLGETVGNAFRDGIQLK